jgi:Tfp pilus assembly protein PilE
MNKTNRGYNLIEVFVTVAFISIFGLILFVFINGVVNGRSDDINATAWFAPETAKAQAQEHSAQAQESLAREMAEQNRLMREQIKLLQEQKK